MKDEIPLPNTYEIMSVDQAVQTDPPEQVNPPPA
jgi:hypothetical protein